MVQYRLLLFLPIGQALKKYSTLKFLHGSQWENLNCGISRKQLIVERNGQKFGICGTTVYIGKVLLMPDSLSLVWGHFDSMIFETLLLQQFSSDFKQTSHKAS